MSSLGRIYIVSYKSIKRMADSMRKLDLYWMSNRDWWELKDLVPTIRADAPPEAKASYERYLKQTEDE